MSYENQNAFIIISLFVMLCAAMYIFELHYWLGLKDKEISTANIALASCQDNMMEAEFTWFTPDECEWNLLTEECFCE